MVLAVKRFRVYLAKEFNLITDHRALKSLQTMSMEDMNDRRSRWLLFLQQFQIKPIHKAGKSSVMSMADYLSRVRSDGSHPNTAEIRVTRERIESAVVEFLVIGSPVAGPDCFRSQERTQDWNSVRGD